MTTAQSAASSPIASGVSARTSTTSGSRPAEAMPEDARDEGRDARPRRGDRGEIDGGEESHGSQRHVALLAVRLASALSASTREEKNIAA
jgi:hypothetical protein